MSPIPVTILGGYLGVGKTTTVNHLLRHADGRRIAVLVNDFGTLSIDADLIEADDGALLSIAGGCVCCTYGDDLVTALLNLQSLPVLPDHVIIETSGVALPRAVAQALNLLFTYAVDTIVVLADAATTSTRLDDRFMGDTLSRQFADADLIALNKCDLVDKATQAALAARLACLNPAARQVATTYGTIAPAFLFDPVDLPVRRLPPGNTRMWTAHASLSFVITGAGNIDALATRLMALDLVRVKGFVRDSTHTMRTLHLAGARITLHPAPDNVTDPQRLVCIAAGPSIDREGVERALIQSGYSIADIV